MTTTETRHWNEARGYAARQGCDAAVSCAYADHAVRLIRAGQVPDFGTWVRENS